MQPYTCHAIYEQLQPWNPQKPATTHSAFGQNNIKNGQYKHHWPKTDIKIAKIYPAQNLKYKFLLSNTIL